MARPALSMPAVLLACACGGGVAKDPPAGGEVRGASAFEAGPEGSRRAELELTTFDLPPGGEVYRCQNFENPFGRDVAIVESQSRMSAGSHHLTVFRYEENANGAIEDCSGLEFHTTIHAAQLQDATTRYPDGIGAFLPGDAGIRLNAHYVNLTDETIHAVVRVALDYVDASEVKSKAAQIYLNDSTLSLPPGKATGGGTLTLPSSVGSIELLSAQSHMHRRGTHFDSEVVGGSSLYRSDSWHEPPVTVYDPTVRLAPGAEISWKCEYENETRRTLVFGESADTDEMCVFTGFYFPAPDGLALVGDVALGTVELMR